MAFGPLNPITKEEFESFVQGWPAALIVSVYCVSKYHEKYNVTSWCQQELVRRGFKNIDLSQFDEQFGHFYHQLLEQNDL